MDDPGIGMDAFLRSHDAMDKNAQFEIGLCTDW